MLDFRYCLNYNECTVKNALALGNCMEHFRRAEQGRLGDRVVHTLIGIFLLLPIVGQIGALFERHIILCSFKSDRDFLAYKALTCRTVIELMDRCKFSSNNWKVKFVHRTVIPFGGECDFHKKTIFLKNNLNDAETLSIFVFELTNVLHKEKFKQVYKKALSHQIGEEDFAKEYEHIEWGGAHMHHKMMRRAIVENGWDSSTDSYNNLEKDFEITWKRIKHSSHTQGYRNYWKKFTSAQ